MSSLSCMSELGSQAAAAAYVQCRIIHVARVANATGLGPQDIEKNYQGLEYPKMLSTGACKN